MRESRALIVDGSDASPERIHVLVADSTPFGEQLLCGALGQDARFVVEAQGKAGAGMSARSFEIGLISAALGGESLAGIELARQLRVKQVVGATVILVDESTREIVLQSFRSGARGVFCRNQSVESLGKCLWMVHQGHVWASHREVSFLLDALGEPLPIRLRDAKGEVLLSKREEDVVSAVVEGLTNREIADRLELSEHTIKNYLFRVFDKLGVSSRAELILYTLNQVGNLSWQAVSASLQISGGQGHPASQESQAIVQCCHEAAERLIAVTRSLREKPARGGQRTLALDSLKTYMLLTAIKSLSHSVQETMKAHMPKQEIANAQKLAKKWLQENAPAAPDPDACPSPQLTEEEVEI
jgi:DNA-binding NarL/FixJ family response regulator